MKLVKFWHRWQSNIQTKDIGQGSVIHSHCWIGKDVKIGQRVKIEAMCFIPMCVTIEDDVFLGPAVVCTNDFYPPSDDWRPTLIKRGAAIGANCTIVCGITIGENAMIGAGSVVTHDVPAGELWYGNPARKRGIRE